MRLFLRTSALATLLAGCAAPPSVTAQRTAPPEPALPTSQIPLPPHLMAQSDPEAYARRLFAGFHERIVQVEEHRSGPGYPVFSHVTLYERPESSHHAGLCQVRVHDVGVPHVQPPAEPSRDAVWVRTGIRWFAIGKVDSSIRPADQAARCAALTNLRDFFSAPESEAFSALQILGDAHYFAASMPRAISFACTAYAHPCADPADLFRRYMKPDRLASVQQVPCESENLERPERCYQYVFRALPDGPTGDWSAIIGGPGRPLHVIIRQQQPPVV